MSPIIYNINKSDSYYWSQSFIEQKLTYSSKLMTYNEHFCIIFLWESRFICYHCVEQFIITTEFFLHSFIRFSSLSFRYEQERHGSKYQHIFVSEIIINNKWMCVILAAQLGWTQLYNHIGFPGLIIRQARVIW